MCCLCFGASSAHIILSALPFLSLPLLLYLPLHSLVLFIATYRHVCHSARRCCLQGSQDPLHQGSLFYSFLSTLPIHPRLVPDLQKEPLHGSTRSSMVGSKSRPSSLLPSISLDCHALYGLSGCWFLAWCLQCQEERQCKDFFLFQF